MKKFAELEFVKNLGWLKLIGLSATIITVYTSAIWTVTSRVIDSRWAQIESLDKEIALLKEENIELRKKLPNLSSEGISSKISNTQNTPITNNTKEFKKNEMVTSETLGFDIDFIVTSIWSNGISFKATLYNGEVKENALNLGDSFVLQIHDKKYQFLLLGIDESKSVAKIRIKEIQQ